MKKIRVGIVGCGVICGNHIVPLTENDKTEVVAVCDIVEEKAKSKASELGCAAYTDYKEMIEKENLDSIHICLPHYLHSTVAIYALERGLDVLCEKPMDINSERAKLMIEAAEKSSGKLGIIFQNRYNIGSVLVKESLDSGKLGKILGISAQVVWRRDQCYYDSGDWRGKWLTEGGGVLINQAIHTLDLSRYFIDSEVVDVKATATHFGATTVEVEDTANGMITFENGAKLLFYFTVTSVKDHKISVTLDCENGTAELLANIATISYKDGTVESSQNIKEYIALGKECYGTGHYKQIDEFYSEGNREKVRATMYEAYKTQKLLDEIYDVSGMIRK